MNITMNSKTSTNNRFWKRILFLVAALAASQGGTYLVLSSLGAAGQAYSNLIINTVFLFTCVGCIRLFKLTPEDVGLRVLWQRRALHVGLCLAIFSTCCLYYLFVVRISGLHPFTSATIWGLLNYLVVAFAEEIYFRGLCYHVVEERTSGRAAIVISGLLFGLVHFRQGLGMLPKFFTGWLWGSVRYATGMIHLLIFPVHFTYNAVWLLFQGNWDSPMIFALLFPLLELLGAILIVAGIRKGVERRVFGAAEE
jgi:membrane protease YdiL (CAAX protease family)